MDAHPLKLKVQSIVAETSVIRSVVFGVEGGAVPEWQAGAHVRVLLPSGADRPYSLMALPDLPEGAVALGVLREETSTGGSLFMHALQVGDVVSATAPVNNFGLHEGAAPALLFAGGIGVTPLIPMMQAASASRCFQPPDSVPASWLRRVVRPSSSSVAPIWSSSGFSR